MRMGHCTDIRVQWLKGGRIMRFVPIGECYLIATILVLAALPLALPGFYLLTVTLAALGARRQMDPPPRATASAGAAVRVAVLVPAHNESSHALPTIESLLRQLGPRDRLLLVADNCTDDTAALARAAGAEVVERHDSTLRGKGYALAFGVDHLRVDPPDVVMVVDADCFVSEGGVAQITQVCFASGHPVQMPSLMTAEPGAGLRFRVLEFAMRMKNLVRPLGMQRLVGACQLMGTGMALPWALISTAKLASGHIVEDINLGVELARKGYPPQFLACAKVGSVFLSEAQDVQQQKARWEHGHLATVTEQLPRLIASAIAQRSLALTFLALDLLTPPVSLYLMSLLGFCVVAALLAWVFPVFGPMATVLEASFACFAVSILLAWFFFARHLLSARELITTPLYALWKFPIYLAFFLKKRSGWVRARRKGE